MPRREAGDERVALVAEIDQLEHVVADLAPLRRPGCGTRRRRTPGTRSPSCRRTRRRSRACSRSMRRISFGLRVDRVAADVGLAPGGVQQRGENPHRRRLAGAVGADEAEHVAAIELQVDRLDGEQLAVFLRQVAGFDHGGEVGGRDRVSCRQAVRIGIRRWTRLVHFRATSSGGGVGPPAAATRAIGDQNRPIEFQQPAQVAIGLVTIWQPGKPLAARCFVEHHHAQQLVDRRPVGEESILLRRLHRVGHAA